MDQGLAQAQVEIASAVTKSSASPIHQVVAVMGSGLRFRFQACHKHVLQVLAQLFNRLGASASPLADSILVSLAEVSTLHMYMHIYVCFSFDCVPRLP